LDKMPSIFLLASTLAVAFGVGTFTSDDINVSWDISDGEVTFIVQVSSDIASEFNYWGIGLNPDDDDMDGADLWIIQEDGTVLDYWGIENDNPPLDTDYNGTDDIHSVTHTSSDGGYITTFTRDLDTGDSADVKLVEGDSYALIWAFGKSTSTTFLDHKESDSGSEDIDFTNDYSGDDDSAYYFTGAFSLACAALQIAY